MLQLLPVALWLASPSPFTDVAGDLPDLRPPTTAATRVEVRTRGATVRRLRVASDDRTFDGEVLRLEYAPHPDRFFVLAERLENDETASPDVVLATRPPPRVTFTLPEYMFEIPSILLESDPEDRHRPFVFRVYGSSDGIMVWAFHRWSFYNGDGNIRGLTVFRRGQTGRWTTTALGQSDEAVLLDDGSVLLPRARGRVRDHEGQYFRGPHRITLDGQIIPYHANLHSVAQGPGALWGIRRRILRDILVWTDSLGRVRYEAPVREGTRAFRPMPFSAGACVASRARDSETLECHDGNGLRFSTSTTTNSTYLTDGVGRVFVGTTNEIVAFGRTGTIEWRLDTTLRSNLVATPRGELCWLEEADSSMQIRCLGVAE